MAQPKLGNIGVQENIDTSSDSEAQRFKKLVVKTNNSNLHSGYDYTTPFEQYTNKVADQIGTYSTAPANLFVQWTDDPYNKFPASIYKEIAPMRNETICKVEYMETYEVAAGYWKQEPIYGQINSCAALPTGGQHCTSYGGIVGYQSVWEPAIYGKKKVQACIQNTLVDAYCSTKECVTTCNNATKGGQCFWSVSAWTGCSNGCGAGLQYRTVVCKDKNGNTFSDGYCSGAGAKPATQQACQGVTSCGYSWAIGGWSACSDPVNGGYQTRHVYCRRSDGSIVADAYCGGKPNTVQQCSNPSAPECVKYGTWVYSGIAAKDSVSNAFGQDPRCKCSPYKTIMGYSTLGYSVKDFSCFYNTETFLENLTKKEALSKKCTIGSFEYLGVRGLVNTGTSYQGSGIYYCPTAVHAYTCQ